MFWVFVTFVVINGIFQGNVGPSFITIANWFPSTERGRVSSVWNISHNIGGGIVSPIIGASLAVLGTGNWQIASFIVPAIISIFIAFLVIYLGKGSPVQEGLPELKEIVPEK